MVNTSHAKHEFPYVVLVVLRRVSAAVVAITALCITMWAYDVNWGEPYQALFIIAALLALMLFPGRNASTDILPPRFWSISLSIVSRWFLLVGILLLLGYATKTSSIFSRRALFTWFIVAPPLLVLAQLLVEVLISRMLMSAGNRRRVVIAGAGDLGHQLASKIQSTPMLGMEVDGFFDDRGMERLENDSAFPVLGNLRQLPDYVREHSTDLIFVVLPIRNIQRVTELLAQLHDTTASIYFVPDVFVFDLIQCRTSDIDGLPIVALCETPFQGTEGAIKALSDYTIASIVLLLTSPILIAIALAIKLTSPGSVIFKQRRYGLDGHEIIVYKFRSMTVSEDSDHVKQATRDDERVTKVGAFLRKTSLDELPQFINVLQGRMSVVGPRPHAVAHNEEYRPLIKGYMIRHKVNPGITGLAQVMGYRGETRTVEAMRKRVEYDLEYLRNWSLTLDLRIIVKTIGIVWNDKTAY
ncbi:MAG: undecaprenyl-phosphate glucose phosphotransferase [Woeseiaceae bacterium]|nr:undecaprenyl-phosphate glucose phosphotransferase [Woeseiaceae bacterium]